MQWQWSNSNSTFSCLVGVSIHMYICIDILYLSVVWKRLQSGLQSSEESCTLRWTHLSVCFEVKYFDENLLKQFRMTKLAFQMLWSKISQLVGPVFMLPHCKAACLFWCALRNLFCKSISIVVYVHVFLQDMKFILLSWAHKCSSTFLECMHTLVFPPSIFLCNIPKCA